MSSANAGGYLRPSYGLYIDGKEVDAIDGATTEARPHFLLGRSALPPPCVAR